MREKMFTVGLRRPRYSVIVTHSRTKDEDFVKDLDTHVQKVPGSSSLRAGTIAMKIDVDAEVLDLYFE
jgi:hypothetical protein